jgi:hypothetical protein
MTGKNALVAVAVLGGLPLLTGEVGQAVSQRRTETRVITVDERQRAALGCLRKLGVFEHLVVAEPAPECVTHEADITSGYRKMNNGKYSAPLQSEIDDFVEPSDREIALATTGEQKVAVEQAGESGSENGIAVGVGVDVALLAAGFIALRRSTGPAPAGHH